MLDKKVAGLRPENNSLSYQFGCQLVSGILENLRNLAPVHSVRDRGVGGSNPLAPTRIFKKEWPSIDRHGRLRVFFYW
jgi:hypothetical protein